jgi:hypothetical protein
MASENQGGEAVTAPDEAATQPTAPHSPRHAKLKRSAIGSKDSDQAKRPAGAAHVQPRRAERRPEMIRQRREDRRKEYERRQRQWLYTRIGLGAFALLVVAGVAWGVITYLNDRAPATPEGTQTFAYTGGQHQDGDLTYAENPPVGGPHNAVWQNCGYYDAPIAEENAVHSLEHGAVWITYRPDLPQDQIDELRELADGQTYVLVSPRSDLPAPVVASAWNRQLQLPSANDEKLDQFVRRFRRSSEAPEPRGICTGGVGSPV